MGDRAEIDCPVSNFGFVREFGEVEHRSFALFEFSGESPDKTRVVTACRAYFFSAEIVVVESYEMFTVAAHFDCSEFEEVFVEAVFKNCEISALSVRYRFCESENYAASVAQNYNVVRISHGLSESFFGGLPLFSNAFADFVIFVACCPCCDSFIVFADGFFNGFGEFAPRRTVAAFVCKIGSVGTCFGHGFRFSIFVESNLAEIDFSAVDNIVESAPFIRIPRFFGIVLRDYKVFSVIELRDVEKRVAV